MPTNRSVFVGEEDIEVSVQNGVATLEGEVDSMMELDQAIKDAFDGGARRVINRLDTDDQPDYYKDLYFRDYRWPYWTIWPSLLPLWS